MFGFVKLLTRSGRQELVRGLMKEYLTPEVVGGIAASAVAKVLDKSTAKVSDERCAQIALGCTTGCNALTHLAAAIDPNGEDGKSVSVGEREVISNDIKAAIPLLVSKEGLESACELVIAKVP